LNFKEFLQTMWGRQGGTVSPRELFTQIARKWKVFKGMRQQDSQELMRYLFDGIKQEETDLIKRQLAGEKIEDGEVEDEDEDDQAHEQGDEKKVVSATGTKEEDKPPKYIPFIDSCFSGKMVSLIVCDVCKKVKRRGRLSFVRRSFER
jgi:ubiquitin carboxyl-terminal hydrolase 16/45